MIFCLALFLANSWAVDIEFFLFLAYPAYVAYRVNQGFDYRYPVQANLIEKKRRPDAG